MHVHTPGIFQVPFGTPFLRLRASYLVSVAGSYAMIRLKFCQSHLLLEVLSKVKRLHFS